MDKHKLRILLISPIPPPAGGIATWTKQYINWTIDKNLKIAVVNTSVTGKRAQKSNAERNIADEIKRTLVLFDNLKIKIKKFKPNIIHINTSCSHFGILRDYFFCKIAKRKEIKLFVHYHCNIEDQVKEKKIQNFFLNKISNLADYNFVLNKQSFDFLRNRTISKINIMSNFLDSSFYDSSKYTVKKNIKVVTFIGNIQRSKGLFEIISAAKDLPNIIFKLAGPVANELKDVVIPENIMFLGTLSKSEVKKLLLISDVFLFPSYTEGFSVSVLEAMSLGVPIIATPVGANKQMIEKYGGTIVEVANSEEIIKSIKRMDDFEIRQKMSSWNINKVKNEYTTNIIMKKILEFYKK